MRTTLFAAAAALGLALTMGAEAADEAGAIAHQTWSFSGIFGTFDQKAAQRGFQVYKEICSNCHSLKELYYRNLEEIGLTEDQVKAIAAEVKVTDGPNDQGEMFERPGKPSDHFKSPFPNDQAARAANGGGLPPDLSLIVKAREGGADYVYAVLTGFTQPPAGFKVTEGTFYNAAFPGHLIKMPPPLTDGAVTYADKTKATVPQMAHDVVTFLTWASEPELDTRHRLGVKVMIFLLVLAGLLYAVKRKVWAEVH